MLSFQPVRSIVGTLLCLVAVCLPLYSVDAASNDLPKAPPTEQKPTDEVTITPVQACIIALAAYVIITNLPQQEEQPQKSSQ